MRGTGKISGSPLSQESTAQDTSMKESPYPDAIVEVDTHTSNPQSNDIAKVKTYVPSPPSGGSDMLSEYMAKLSTEQHGMISDFIQATKEPISVAIQTLKECEWDLVRAVSRFGDDEDDDDDTEDWEKDTLAPSAPLDVPRRSTNPSMTPHQSVKESRFRKISGSLRREALLNLTMTNGKDWPKSAKTVAHEVITVQHSPSNPNSHTIPIFISPYKDKIWYTGFMEP